MAEREERYFVGSVVRGFHDYKDIWNPVVGEIRICQQDFGFMIRMLWQLYVVTVSLLDMFLEQYRPNATLFLRMNGTISCQITGRRQRSVDLPQGGLEVPCTLTFFGKSRHINKVKKLFGLAPAKSIEPPVAKKARIDSIEPIVLGAAAESNLKDETTWLTFHGSLLTESDRKAIVSNDLLNDRHIKYAQTLLHHQFPSVEGLQDTLSQRKKSKKITRGIQIIHDRGNHWIVASTINCDNANTIQLYDSIYPTMSDGTVCVIKNLFEFTAETKIVQMKMQRQCGSQDCGLFAIAVSTALLNELDASQLKFHQGEMRQHLTSCFKANSLTVFPSVQF